MKQKQLEHICLESCKIIKEVGTFIKTQQGKVSNQQIELKGLNSLVSYVDKTAERQLVAQLKKLLPGAFFLTEEETVEQKKGKYQWIIDPLDGTTNFLHQLPCYAVSVALQADGKTVVGIVYEPNNKECFYAWKEGGAFLNGQPVRCSSNNDLANTLIATGFPYHDFKRVETYTSILKYLMKNTRGIRRWGAAAVDLAYVACGRFDAFYEYGLNPWDVAAGAFIVEEAGGKVADFSGGPGFLFGREIIAANNGVFEKILQIVKNRLQTPQ
ncbi:MAG TPA: inositol monophosphatase [Bacteroidetes bacterium]|nr:inositol monophosphatase [Bacteroidota bacterium]